MALRHLYTPGSHKTPSPRPRSGTVGRQRQRSEKVGEPEWTVLKVYIMGLGRKIEYLAWT